MTKSIAKQGLDQDTALATRGGHCGKPRRKQATRSRTGGSMSGPGTSATSRTDRWFVSFLTHSRQWRHASGTAEFDPELTRSSSQSLGCTIEMLGAPRRCGAESPAAIFCSLVTGSREPEEFAHAVGNELRAADNGTASRRLGSPHEAERCRTSGGSGRHRPAPAVGAERL